MTIKVFLCVLILHQGALTVVKCVINDVIIYDVMFVTQINHVIQYDFPTSVTDYLHRVGRTGRVGGVTQCLATTLMTKKKDVRVALKIEVHVQKPLQIFIKNSQCM